MSSDSRDYIIKRLLVSLLLIFTPTTVFAEEVEEVEEVVVVEEAYAPPPEASEGAGGWAVINSDGIVHGVVVCTIDVCGPNGSFAGVLPLDYQECPGCTLRFQTRATSNGNVAGYSGHYYTQDSDGNVTTNNDKSVKWNSSDNTFDINKSDITKDGTITTKKKLIPSKTSADGERIDTGLEKIETEFKSSAVNDTSVKVKVLQNSIDDPKIISVEYDNWIKLNYPSTDLLKDNLDIDINTALVQEDSNLFVDTIKSLTIKVKKFFGMIFGE